MVPLIVSQVVLPIVTAIVIPLLAYLLAQAIQTARAFVESHTAQIKDARVRSFVTTLVAQAEATIPKTLTSNAERFSFVSAGVHTLFPQVPASTATALIEEAVLNLHKELGTFTPATAPAAPPAPAFDLVGLEHTLTENLASLVPVSLHDQIGPVIHSAIGALSSVLPTAVPTPHPENVVTLAQTS